MKDYMQVTTDARSAEATLTALLLVGLAAGGLAALLLWAIAQGSAFARGVLQLLPL